MDTKIKLFVIVMFFMFCLGCLGKDPKNVENQQLYQRHHEWCLKYGTINKSSVHTETYQQCMERFGYIY